MSEASSCGCGSGGCGAGNTTQGLTITMARTEDTMPNTLTTLKIDGMTCGHCVASVTEELREVPGVEDVEVFLSAGGTSTATVTTSAPIAHALLTEAVTEAGYTVVSVGA